MPHPDTLVITISQSGETADTLAALQHAKALGMTDTLCDLQRARERADRARSKLRFLTRAGPEIGVASTKAFTTQLAALFVLTLVLAKQRGRLPREARAANCSRSCATCPARWPTCSKCEPADARTGPKRFAPQGARAVPRPRRALSRSRWKARSS